MNTDPANVFARAWNGPRAKEPKLNMIGHTRVETAHKNGVFVFTSPDLPELLVVSKDLQEGIDDLIPSIREIRTLKERTRAGRPTRPIVELWKELGIEGSE